MYLNVKKVLYCIRSHRCKDVLPQTLEAKIIAFIDSASYLTSYMYFDMAMSDKAKGEEFKAYSKAARDYRDLELFPEVKNELNGLYEAWIKLLNEYEKINFK